MKTKTFSQAAEIINNIMDDFTERVKLGLTKQTAIIENISLADIITLYRILPVNKFAHKELFMPGEIGNENITIVFIPANHCIITIESEPCVDYLWKVKSEFVNLN